jgi:hypothetical protein
MTQVNTTPNDFEARHLIANDAGLKIWGFDDALEATMPKGPQGAGAFRCVAPWPAVLEHAPTAELVAALKGREGVESTDVEPGKERYVHSRWYPGPATLLYVLEPEP